ncbi:MAG: flagellar biosynthetic protein FliO [Firmicutes bacterium]|nr:flagellar biosynthetic protein FliO [Bacillota bacterium]
MNIFTLTILGVINRSTDTWFTIKYVVVATVFLLLLWGLSRYVTNRHSVIVREKNIKVIERVAISNEKSIYLFLLDGIYYLVASDKSGMTLLDKREHLNLEPSKKIEPQSGAFFEQLKSALIKNEKQKEKEIEIENHSKEREDE